MDNGNSRGQTRYLLFYVGGCLYAIEACRTLGVCEVATLTHWTGARPYMIGFTLLDDFIWSVMDLQIWLRNKKTNRNGRGTFLAVAVEDGKRKFLALIDSVFGIADIFADMIDPADELARTNYIKGYINTGDVIARLLSTEGMFET